MGYHKGLIDHVGDAEIASQLAGAAFGAGCAAASSLAFPQTHWLPVSAAALVPVSQVLAKYSYSAYQQKRFAPPPIISSRLNYLVQQQVVAKYKSDLSHSCLLTPADAMRARALSMANAQRSWSIQGRDRKLQAHNWIREIPLDCWRGLIPRKIVETLQEFGLIRIAATSTAAAPVAIFLRNKQFFREIGIDIYLDFRFPWGGSMMKALDEANGFHFAFTIDAPFFFSTEKGPSEYRHALTTSYDANVLLRRQSKVLPHIRRCHVIHGTTADEASRSGAYFNYGCEERETDFSSLHELARSIEDAEAIWVWSCLLSDLKAKGILVSVPFISYESYRSIIYHKTLDTNRAVTIAFLSLFVALWAREKMLSDHKMLSTNIEFLNCFARSMGG